jgi:hypothetical protein
MSPQSGCIREVGMKPPIFLFLLLLVVGAAPCAAGTPGIDLGWNSCSTAAANSNIEFACDTNDRGTPFALVMAFRSAHDIPDMAGVSMVIDFCTGPLTLPNWWMFGSGQCRGGSFVFPAPAAGVGNTCENVWAGHPGGGGFVFTAGYGGKWNSARIVMDFGISDGVAATAGTRYLAGVATMDDGSGDPVCAGCDYPACFVLNSVEVVGFAPGEDYLIEAADSRQYVMWQGGAVGGAGCPFVVATRTSTWGAIKAMYR